MNIDPMFMLMAVTITIILANGWRNWPNKLAPGHDGFRHNGEASVFREEMLTGRLVQTGLTLKSSVVRFEDKATFVLLPPAMKSGGIASLNGAELRVQAVTRFPTMKSYFIMK